MKRITAIIFTGMLCALAADATAGPESLNAFPLKVLPVLMRVDAHGAITEMSPSVQLRPQFRRLLRKDLEEMIARPAMDHGHPVASQFIIKLSLDTSPRKDGKYDARFAYVSLSPVPNGSWYWVHENGHRLALVSRDGLHGDRHRFNDFNMPSRWSDIYQSAPSPSAQSSFQGTASQAGRSASVHGHQGH